MHDHKVRRISWCFEHVICFLGGIPDKCVSLLLYSDVQFRRQRGIVGYKRPKGTIKEDFLGLLDFSFDFTLLASFLAKCCKKAMINYN